MPKFWEDYDRGTSTYDQMIEALMEYNKCPRELAVKNVNRSIVTQEEVKPTKHLIEVLKAEGYKLYVLSNMSKEFIEFLRTQPVYELFDGEVVSCEELVVKPEREIYDRLIERYSLDASETLFIDDRKANIDTACELGWQGYLFDHNNASASCAELYAMLIKR